MNTLTSNQKVLVSALVGFIIGAAAIWVWTVSTAVPQTGMEAKTDVVAAVDNATDSETETEMPTKTITEVVPESPAVSPARSMSNSDLITVAAQKAGMSVKAHVTFEAPGWVAVHEENAGGIGNVLGANWLPSGEQDVTVDLLRATVAGMTYHVVLYNDDGDRQFDYKKGDANLLDGSKQPIQASFKAN